MIQFRNHRSRKILPHRPSFPSVPLQVVSEAFGIDFLDPKCPAGGESTARRTGSAQARQRERGVLKSPYDIGHGLGNQGVGGGCIWPWVPSQETDLVLPLRHGLGSKC